MKNEQLIEEFQEIEEAFNEAIISNDVNKIAEYVSSDWVLIDTQGGIIQGERFFDVVKQGMLSHSTMTKEILRVKLYNNIAVVTSRGKNTGVWKGQPIQADEWVTDIYKKEGESWVCVLTHLTPVSEQIN